ncbi:MAG: bifunctional precorrin-2 dehydrogenase/sirohydrochlorin ferrochelatase [Deltaproteobacteria bacterium]|jgi:siroheme synthase-like protein|nr:bifunctional precorrin-2 dehydrogenase/sirohydrochlorin ferrochelatase [Deltaproteobacteria bacterium]
MPPLSINLELKGRKALVVGAGKVGSRKLSYLLHSGAELIVVEPNPSDGLLKMAKKGRIDLQSRFSTRFLKDSPLVFVTVSTALSDDLLEEIKERDLWLNVADRPEIGNFTLPAVLEDGPFRLAVSTGGNAPALAAKVSRSLRDRFKGYGAFARIMGAVRPFIVKSKLLPERRAEIFRALADNEDIPSYLAEERFDEALELVARLIRPVKLPADFSLE